MASEYRHPDIEAHLKALYENPEWFGLQVAADKAEDLGVPQEVAAKVRDPLVMKHALAAHYEHHKPVGPAGGGYLPIAGRDVRLFVNHNDQRLWSNVLWSFLRKHLTPPDPTQPTRKARESLERREARQADTDFAAGRITAFELMSRQMAGTRKTIDGKTLIQSMDGPHELTVLPITWLHEPARSQAHRDPKVMAKYQAIIQRARSADLDPIEALEPVQVEPHQGTFFVRDGHHRIEAAEKEGLEEIRAWVPMTPTSPSRQMSRGLRLRKALNTRPWSWHVRRWLESAANLKDKLTAGLPVTFRGGKGDARTEKYIRANKIGPGLRAGPKFLTTRLGEENEKRGLMNYESILRPPQQLFRSRRVRKAAYITASPNITRLTLDQAIEELSGDRHRTFKKAAQAAFESMGLDVKSHDALGAWSDGAEDAEVHMLNTDPGEDKVRQIGSLLGLLGDQKSVLTFREGKGNDLLHRLHIPDLDAREAHKRLISAGIDFHTLVPGRSGVTAFVFDVGGKTSPLVASAARSLNAQVRSTPGRGTFLGSGEEHSSDRAHRQTSQGIFKAHLPEELTASRVRPREGLVSSGWPGSP